MQLAHVTRPIGLATSHTAKYSQGFERVSNNNFQTPLFVHNQGGVLKNIELSKSGAKGIVEKKIIYSQPSSPVSQLRPL